MQVRSVILLAALSATAQNAPHKNTCTVHAAGNSTDDAPAILAAFAKCGEGGNIVLPSANYTISRPMTTHLEGGQFNLHGYLSFTPDIDYWITNSYRFPFQNQSIAWHITGRDFIVDGHSTGGVFRNGQVWYSWARGAGNLYGRPMSVSIMNATRVVIKNFRIIQPQFWSSLVWNSTDILLTDFYVNATNLDPAANGQNWVQNTDGSNTYESARNHVPKLGLPGRQRLHRVQARFHADYCKERELHGGEWDDLWEYWAVSEFGQWGVEFDILQDIHIEDIVVKNHPTFKSWLGVNVGIPPNGGGGGGGYCKNVTIKNLHIIDATVPLLLTSEYGFPVPTTYYAYLYATPCRLTYSQLNATYANTSTFVWDSVHFYNVTGTSATGQVIDFECSTTTPCEGWTFSDIDLTPVGGVKKTGIQMQGLKFGSRSVGIFHFWISSYSVADTVAYSQVT
ncbi:putative galacturan 1,4-alpha-galacturonidase A [Mycena alexandri]|uniref:galacturonan 1,4-alpha-galacturonidase n=1 Tax=Mycena alexandri TaxID=1745969 RepID=A0AAD6T6E6_9AGAR|nr:putative galacturan 1,4-alpha-galacturonidase A [Mycena alexandri]